MGLACSWLQGFLKRLLGKCAVAMDGRTTEPGIRRTLAKNALAALIDEGETETSKVHALLLYLRSGSSGSEILVGDGARGTAYTVRSAGMVSAVDMPSLNSTDAGRFLTFELVAPPDKHNKHRLIGSGHRDAGAIGLRLFSKMVHSWPRVRRAHALLNSELVEGSSRRYSDTLAPVLASGWCLLHDGELDRPAARALIDSIDLTESKEAMEQSDKDQAVLERILWSTITVTMSRERVDMTVQQACNIAAIEAKSAAAHALSVYGLKVHSDGDGHRLLINEKSPQLMKLYVGTKWENANLETALKRVPGASQKKTSHTVYIGSSSIRALSLPLTVQPCPD
jgi:hypothetical protein